VARNKASESEAAPKVELPENFSLPGDINPTPADAVPFTPEQIACLKAHGISCPTAITERVESILKSHKLI
jgi:hypothetical protein